MDNYPSFDSFLKDCTTDHELCVNQIIDPQASLSLNQYHFAYLIDPDCAELDRQAESFASMCMATFDQGSSFSRLTRNRSFNDQYQLCRRTYKYSRFKVLDFLIETRNNAGSLYIPTRNSLVFFGDNLLLNTVRNQILNEYDMIQNVNVVRRVDLALTIQTNLNSDLDYCLWKYGTDDVVLDADGNTELQSNMWFYDQEIELVLQAMQVHSSSILVVDMLQENSSYRPESNPLGNMALCSSKEHILTVTHTNAIGDYPSCYWSRAVSVVNTQQPSLPSSRESVYASIPITDESRFGISFMVESITGLKPGSVSSSFQDAPLNVGNPPNGGPSSGVDDTTPDTPREQQNFRGKKPPGMKANNSRGNNKKRSFLPQPAVKKVQKFLTNASRGAKSVVSNPELQQLAREIASNHVKRGNEENTISKVANEITAMADNYGLSVSRTDKQLSAKALGAGANVSTETKKIELNRRGNTDAKSRNSQSL